MKLSYSFLLASLAPFAARGSDTNTSSIVDIVAASEDHTTLEAAVLAAPEEIAELLGSPSETGYTLFAPDDDAFAAVDADYLNQLLTDPWADHLVCVLTSHVLGSTVLSTDLMVGETVVPSVSGYVLEVEASPNGAVSVEEIPVTDADIIASNGVVHVISEMPILPDCVTDTVYEVVEDDGNFTILESLLDEAGLIDTIATLSPLTLLAPTDAAFEAVPAEVLEYLGGNTSALTEVLTYHALNSLDKLEAGMSYTTVEGSDIELNGDMMINDSASIEGERVLASNGAVYVIDAVLLPPGFTIPTDDTMAPVMAPVTSAPTAAETSMMPVETPAPVTAAPSDNPTMAPSMSSANSVMMSTSMVATLLFAGFLGWM